MKLLNTEERTLIASYQSYCLTVVNTNLRNSELKREKGLSYKGKVFSIIKIMKRSREVIEKQGFRALLKQTMEKVTKREFGISNSAIPQIATQAGHHNKSKTGLSTEFGVNLAGYFTGRLGIGASSRAFGDALEIGNIPHVLNNLRGRDESFHVHYSFASNNPYPINIIHANADAIEFIFRDTKYVKEKYNIGIWYWELSDFPKRLALALELVDEIWTTSTFVADTLAKVSPAPVVKITYPLIMPRRIPTYTESRNRFDFMKDRYVFVFAFDFRSVLQRKNPMGLIGAFCKAFSETENVMLVINQINSQKDETGARSLVEAINGFPIKIIDSMLSTEDYLALLAASDCYVSLHRSEGLGIPLAEAMYLGKPVIATGYSGNLDFMNTNNSLLVKYQLKQLDQTYYPYERGNIWAEPDESDAARLMRYVYEHREEAKELGDRASLDVKSSLDPRKSATEIRNRLELVFKKISTR
jgi:glycosyltransferase involved in cell wall biosynthesis